MSSTVYGIAKGVGVVIGAFIVNKLIRKVLDKALAKGVKRTKGLKKVKARVETVSKVVEDAFSTLLWGIVVLTLLSMIGIDITPLLTGAGIIGLAIGFGSKELVKDLVSGFFILFDGYINKGDYVELAGVKGRVEKIGIRTTVIKGEEGVTYIVPNGQITKIARYAKPPSGGAIKQK